MKDDMGINFEHDNELTTEMESRLSPEFVDFYRKTLGGKPATNNFPPSTFQNMKLAFPGNFEAMDVGRTEEIIVPRTFGKNGTHGIPVVVYIPAGTAPSNGWPVVYSIHGGGFVLGDRHTEAPMNTLLCKEARAVVISPEYRRAPTDPFPAAVEDCWEVLLWISDSAKQQLTLDLDRLVIAGASAGGNLAATMINMMTDLGTVSDKLRIRLCALAVPVTDCTAGDAGSGSPTWNDYASWTENAQAPTLSRNKMSWYRNLYLPNLYQRLDWHASPMLVPDNFWAKHPRTWVGVVEVDVLRDEGIRYHEKLRASGIDSTLEVYKGIAHPSMNQGKLFAEGKRFQDDWVSVITKACNP